MVAEAKPQSRHFLSTLAADKVDPAAGTILKATVAKAGVRALGKFVFLDKQGAITRDPDQGVKRVPIFTDEKTLDTLMEAAKNSPRFKVREDHNDLIESRIGYCFNFQRAAADVVVTDIKVFENYRNRGILFDTSSITPELIGLSIDPGELTFELGERDGKTIALMRVKELHAVDVVDAGAITHDGLLLNASVDSDASNELPKPKTQPSDNMAAPTLEEIMAQMKTLGETVGGLAANINACQQAVAKMSTPAAPASDPAMKAEVDALKVQLSAATGTLAQMKKDRALMGFRGSPAERQALASATVEDIEKANAGIKSYLDLVADHVETHKCSRSAAHDFVRQNNAEAYRAHLMSKGVYDQAKDTMKVA